MIRQLTAFTLNIVGAAAIVADGAMIAVGYADHINPVEHPFLAASGILFPIMLLINMAFLLFWLLFKWRRAYITLIGFVAALPPIHTYMPLNMERDVPEGSIKVMSYNVQAYNGKNWGDETAAERVFRYICQCDADILCIQEDMGYCRNKLIQRLDSMYPYREHTLFEERKGNGQGVYSRFPIVAKEQIAYESKGNGSFAYKMLIGADTIILINNHFESNHFSYEDKRRYKDMLIGGLQGDIESDTVRSESRFIANKLAKASAMRAPQADSVHAYIEHHRQYPMIVCGDFNDNPISYTRRTVAEGLTDCYVAAGKGVGLSYNQKGFFVRIDNIMCSKHFVPYNCRVDDGIDASDHYPIYCWLKRE